MKILFMGVDLGGWAGNIDMRDLKGYRKSELAAIAKALEDARDTVLKMKEAEE